MLRILCVFGELGVAYNRNYHATHFEEGKENNGI